MRDSTANEHAQVPRAAVRKLLRWFQPLTTGHRRLKVGILAGSLVVLACQALIPWLVEVLLHHGQWDGALLAVLVALVIVQLGIGYATHLGIHVLANNGALVLRRKMIDRLLRGQVLRTKGVQRSGLVLRVTQDVDRVGEAYEESLARGIPGLARLIVSLALLSVISWQAGLTMTIVSLGFLYFRHRIGSSLVTADQERLEIQSEVGESVDETISGYSILAGLRLKPWQRKRFLAKSLELEHASHRQGVIINRLLLAAHANALIGLVAVVVFALAIGMDEDDLAVVAAALLYVEGAVRGLEALPPWIRDVQRANVTMRRIDQVLDTPDQSDSSTPVLDVANTSGLTFTDVDTRLPAGGRLVIPTLTLPTTGLVGLVTTAGVDATDLLALMSGNAPFDRGSIALNGRDLRDLESGRDVLAVPAETETLEATPAELFSAVAPQSNRGDVERMLSGLGLDDLLSTPGALDTIIGQHGLTLTVNERQRLLAATALAAEPEILILGPLLALADIDTAVSLVESLRASRAQLTVLVTQSAEVAETVDQVLFVDGEQVRFGTHHELLVEVPAYSALWEQRLSSMDVDLSAIGIEPSDHERLLTRLVTEHYSPGDLLYRQGAAADRILFIVSGHVEIAVTSPGGEMGRVAVLGPGNHCGDLRLTVGERRAENAIALDDCIVRSLSRQAIAAGITGMLDRTPAERQIVESLLRQGPATQEELRSRLADLDDTVFAGSLALLLSDEAVREADGVISVVLQRQTRKGSSDLLDKLMDF